MEHSQREGEGSVRSPRRRGRILDRTLNFGVIVIALFIVFRPGGPVFGWVQKQVETRRVRSQLETLWPELISEGHRLDGGSGDVVLIEFSDYQCSFCQRTHPELSDFLSEHKQVGVLYRHLPLATIHQAAEGAARAAICAEQQARFRQMHDHLFETERWSEDQDWAVEAIEIGIPDVARFVACMDAPATHARLARDRKLADALGVISTPTFVTRNGIFRGARDRQGLEALVGVQ